MNDNQVNDLKQLVVKPEAELELGPRDMVLNSGELVELELFGNLKKSISVEKFPGSILLRNYQQGEVICRQGEAGNSAFYIARSKDLESLFGRPLKNSTQSDQAAATAHILGGATRQARPSSWWQRIFSSSPEIVEENPVFISYLSIKLLWFPLSLERTGGHPAVIRIKFLRSAGDAYSLLERRWIVNIKADRIETC